jgi:hypothetical protein
MPRNYKKNNNRNSGRLGEEDGDAPPPNATNGTLTPPKSPHTSPERKVSRTPQRPPKSTDASPNSFDHSGVPLSPSVPPNPPPTPATQSVAVKHDDLPSSMDQAYLPRARDGNAPVLTASTTSLAGSPGIAQRGAEATEKVLRAATQSGEADGPPTTGSNTAAPTPAERSVADPVSENGKSKNGKMQGAFELSSTSSTVNVNLITQEEGLNARLAAAGDPAHSPVLPPKSPSEPAAGEDSSPILYPKNVPHDSSEKHVYIVPEPVHSALVAAGDPIRSPVLPPQSPNEEPPHEGEVVHPRNLTPAPFSPQRHVSIVTMPTETVAAPEDQARTPPPAAAAAAARKSARVRDDADDGAATAVPARIPVKAGRASSGWVCDAAVVLGVAAFIAKCL